MSFLSLRLLHARKVWKRFTSTLGKLHKTRKSKAMKSKSIMKKRRKHLDTTTTTSTKAPKLLSTRRFRCKRIAAVKNVFYGFYKKPAPVYIDKLFKEPSNDFVGYLKPQVERKPRTDQKIVKTPYLLGEEVAAGTSDGGGGGQQDRASTSDDMWESVALGSPAMMQGIDERAEEFITRFRQQMAAQETNLPRIL